MTILLGAPLAVAEDVAEAPAGEVPDAQVSLALLAEALGPEAATVLQELALLNGAEDFRLPTLLGALNIYMLCKLLRDVPGVPGGGCVGVPPLDGNECTGELQR
ncbi:MAG TPA: hypothetical protein VI796_00795, partial [Candidatus Thermoplasmatota archaeon]|nr:hypothetical protein [Candidatus Thermoplasmatota archaeon]